MRLRLLRIYSGVTLEEVRNSSGFEVVRGKVGREPEPTPKELKTLRELDPHGIIIGK